MPRNPAAAAADARCRRSNGQCSWFDHGRAPAASVQDEPISSTVLTDPTFANGSTDSDEGTDGLSPVPSNRCSVETREDLLHRRVVLYDFYEARQISVGVYVTHPGPQWVHGLERPTRSRAGHRTEYPTRGD